MKLQKSQVNLKNHQVDNTHARLDLHIGSLNSIKSDQIKLFNISTACHSQVRLVQNFVLNFDCTKVQLVASPISSVLDFESLWDLKSG